MFRCNDQMLSDVIFRCNVQMSGGVRGERGRAWAAPPKEVAGRAVRAAVLRQYRPQRGLPAFSVHSSVPGNSNFQLPTSNFTHKIKRTSHVCQVPRLREAAGG